MTDPSEAKAKQAKSEYQKLLDRVKVYQKMTTTKAFQESWKRLVSYRNEMHDKLLTEENGKAIVRQQATINLIDEKLAGIISQPVEAFNAFALDQKGTLFEKEIKHVVSFNNVTGEISIEDVQQ